MLLPLCKAAKLSCSYHFARQQTWHGQRRPAAHGRQLPRSPAPGWGRRMQWSAHSTSCCSLGWTSSCLPAGCSTSCAPLGPAQPPPLITRGTPQHKECHRSGVLPITRGTTHHKGYYPSQGADSSHGLLVITRGRIITRDSAHHMGQTHHKLPPLIQKCNHSSQNLLVIKCQYPTVWWSSPESSVHLATETVFSKSTVSVTPSASQTATTNYQNFALRLCMQSTLCRRHMFLQVFY